MPEETPGSPLSTVLELAPVIERLVTAAAALVTCPVGQSHNLPVISGVRLAGSEWDLAITLTRKQPA